MKHLQRHAKPGGGKAAVVIVMLIVFFAGLCYALHPAMTGLVLTHESRMAANHFMNTIATSVPTAADKEVTAISPYPELLAAMQAYNEQIYLDGQSGLCDAWAYQAPSFDLAEYGIEDGIIGVIFIPAIDVEMPIYLGATSDNMAKGAVHLSQTSLPIGGDNTNCVIAGHCGWKGADHFRYLSQLEPGATVTVTNLWESLTYTVCEARVIEPNDIDQILIQDGCDMLTLLTCHPYASGGRYRLVLYCERAME